MSVDDRRVTGWLGAQRFCLFHWHVCTIIAEEKEEEVRAGCIRSPIVYISVSLMIASSVLLLSLVELCFTGRCCILLLPYLPAPFSSPPSVVRSLGRVDQTSSRDEDWEQPTTSFHSKCSCFRRGFCLNIRELLLNSRIQERWVWHKGHDTSILF